MPFRSSTPTAVNGAKPKNGGNEFSVGFERIARALGIETQLELAAILNIRQSSISDAKRRGVIPGEWALKLYRAYRLNPRWVYDGLPPVFLSGQVTGQGGEPGGSLPSFLLKYPEGALVAVRMTDSSMEPVIRRDSFVGLNVRDTDILAGELYGLVLPLEGLTVRRVLPGKTKEMGALSADNPAIPDQQLPMVELLRRIRGRVVWIMALA